MKKLLILTGVIALSLSISTQVMAKQTVTTTTETTTEKIGCPCKDKMHKPQFDREKFEKELNLTDAQKEKLKQMREADKDTMKPIMDKMKSLHEQEKAIFDSNLSEDEKNTKLKPIREEKQAIKKQMKAIHEKNKEAFESILTDKQKKSLEKIKEENKKNFEQNMKNRPSKDDFNRPPRCNCKKDKISE